MAVVLQVGFDTVPMAFSKCKNKTVFVKLEFFVMI